MGKLAGFFWLAALVLVLVGLYLSCSRSESYGPMPDVTLQDLDGNDVPFAQLKGKVVLVNFWATWCPPCRGEIPSFIKLYDAYGDKGFVIVGIAVDRGGKKDVAPFVEKNGINYPIVFDPEGKAEHAFNPGNAIPTTFFVGRNGVIRRKIVGPRSYKYFEKEISKLLAEPMPPAVSEQKGEQKE